QANSALAESATVTFLSCMAAPHCIGPCHAECAPTLKRVLRRRERYGHLEPLRLGVLERDAGTMAVGDRADDGQAESASPLGGVRAAEEAVEHALALGRRNAGTLIHDRQPRAGDRLRFGSTVDADHYLSADRAVSDGVVDEVANEDAKRIAIAVHENGLVRARGLGGSREAQLDLALLGERVHILDRLARTGLECDGLQLQGRAFGLLASEREQLARKMDGALDRATEPRASFASSALIACTIEQLKLQRQRRERRAQLVSRIGDEGPLLLESSPE